VALTSTTMYRSTASATGNCCTSARASKIACCRSWGAACLWRPAPLLPRAPGGAPGVLPLRWRCGRCWASVAHHASVVGAGVPVANVIPHNDEIFGFLSWALRACHQGNRQQHGTERDAWTCFVITSLLSLQIRCGPPWSELLSWHKLLQRGRHNNWTLALDVCLWSHSGDGFLTVARSWSRPSASPSHRFRNVSERSEYRFPLQAV